MKTAYKWVTTILLVVLIAFVAALFLPRVFGLKPLAVLSGSMEPTYHVGSLVYIDEVSPEKVQVGDPITFNIGEDTVVTHRVIEIDEENQSFKTKGDANNTEDGGAVAFSSGIGKPVFSIPYMGYVAVYANTRTGMILLVTLILVVLILTFFPDWLNKNDKGEDGGES